jgi:hypothetical protein
MQQSATRDETTSSRSTRKEATHTAECRVRAIAVVNSVAASGADEQDIQGLLERVLLATTGLEPNSAARRLCREFFYLMDDRCQSCWGRNLGLTHFPRDRADRGRGG